MAHHGEEGATVTEDKSPGDRLLELVVFGPTGLAVTLVEEFPKFVEKGRHRVEGQVHTARLVGPVRIPDGSAPARAVPRSPRRHRRRPYVRARRRRRTPVERPPGVPATARDGARSTTRRAQAHAADVGPARRPGVAPDPGPPRRAPVRRRRVAQGRVPSAWRPSVARQRGPTAAGRRRRSPFPATTACRRPRWCSGSRGCRRPSSRRCAPTRPRTDSGAPFSTGSSSCSPAGTARTP